MKTDGMIYMICYDVYIDSGKVVAALSGFGGKSV
jgi:hypothetical protein